MFPHSDMLSEAKDLILHKIVALSQTKTCNSKSLATPRETWRSI